VLQDGFGLGSSIGVFWEKGLIKSVIIAASLAGFESFESVITSLAGFDGERRPTTRRTHPYTCGFQVAADSFTAHAGRLLDTP